MSRRDNQRREAREPPLAPYPLRGWMRPSGRTMKDAWPPMYLLAKTGEREPLRARTMDEPSSRGMRCRRRRWLRASVLGRSPHTGLADQGPFVRDRESGSNVGQTLRRHSRAIDTQGRRGQPAARPARTRLLAAFDAAASGPLDGLTSRGARLLAARLVGIIRTWSTAIDIKNQRSHLFEHLLGFLLITSLTGIVGFQR